MQENGTRALMRVADKVAQELLMLQGVTLRLLPRCLMKCRNHLCARQGYAGGEDFGVGGGDGLEVGGGSGGGGGFGDDKINEG